MCRVIALDLGGTKLAAAVVAAGGQIVSRLKWAVDGSRVAEQVAGAASAVLAEAGLEWKDVAAAGLIVPGIAYPGGDVWAPNLFGHARVALGPLLPLPVPLRIESDRAGYVLGEQWMGAARGLSDVVFLAVGTGIGAGILSAGRLVNGAGGVAGAVGWFALSPDRRALYKQVGCWEAEAAGPALARRAGMARAEEVAEAARRGDTNARAALRETARWLGMGIANLVSLLNPEMVVLGGGLMHASDLLLEDIRSEVLEWAQPVAAEQARIEVTQLGDDAGLLGAARLALDTA